MSVLLMKGVEYDINNIRKNPNEKNFIFISYQQCTQYLSGLNLKPQDVARLIMLSTYVNYNGILMKNHKTPMSKNDMMEIVRESNTTRFNTLFQLLVEENVILLDKGSGLIHLSTILFKMGGLDSNSKATRIFIDETRYLFQNIKTSDIKGFGYLILLLPWISRSHNIICKNPNEEDIKKVVPLKVSELSNILGIGNKSIFNLRVLLQGMSLKNKTPLIISKTTEGNKFMNMIINPDIFYSGKSKGEGLEYTKALFMR